ncbi:hypothetical protein [Paracoccus aerius]|uniref:LPS export ABC transporter periplasmic protein LptC n=1 Tax=Paracoccus aerius TaxID=1915382 RepID=A0ABS1S3N0_9RHOB|nr:hypothetical protein [Paracoccus aerius]MBL3673154.1 hypothetical protein [Paracoccus aerius]GHG17978.1 hypothetical protein GCM10017322_13580 [Paracoccus aerius]
MNRTRVVRWLRVLLPLAALAMLSTLFLFSRGGDSESQIPYADVDAQAMARDPRLVSPEYAGVTDDGAQLTLRASEAMPGQGGGQAQDLRLDWQRPDGLRADLTAPQAGLADGAIRLDGGVRMTTSTGWTLDAASIDAATDRSRIAADEGVKAEAPFGTLSARRMELAPAPGEDASILNFSGDVRLIYQP